MRLTKVNYRDRNRELKKTSKWYVEFRDQNGDRRRFPAFANKSASEEFARNLEHLVEYFKASGGAIDPSLLPWIADLPRATRDALVKIGILDPRQAATDKTLAAHLDDFKTALRSKGVTVKHVELLAVRIKRILDECGFKRWADIRSGPILSTLSDMAASQIDEKGSEDRGISAQTLNFYLQAMKQFCRWAVKDRRIAESPIAHLTGVNVKTDRRHDRRALTTDEMRQLFSYLTDAPTRFGVPGATRAMLYRIAVETGLRANELRSLTRTSFSFGGKTATVTVDAAYSKRRRQDVVPLRPETAKMLRTFLKATSEGQPVFRLPDVLAKMFKVDLTAARANWIAEAKTTAERKTRMESQFLKYKDKSEHVADFHALRHTFISNLARGGVHPKLAQDLARHSDVNLTMTRYSHTLIEEQAEAVASLPDLTPVLRSQNGCGIGPSCATSETDSVLPQCLRKSDDFPSTSEDGGGRNGADPRRAQVLISYDDLLEILGNLVQPPVGLEPTTCGLQNRCSTN